MTYSTFRRLQILTQDLVMGLSLGIASGCFFAWLVEKGVEKIDGSAGASLMYLGVWLGAVVGTVSGIAAGKAFTAPKTG